MLTASTLWWLYNCYTWRIQRKMQADFDAVHPKRVVSPGEVAVFGSDTMKPQKLHYLKHAHSFTFRESLLHARFCLGTKLVWTKWEIPCLNKHLEYKMSLFFFIARITLVQPRSMCVCVYTVESCCESVKQPAMCSFSCLQNFMSVVRTLLF